MSKFYQTPKKKLTPILHKLLKTNKQKTEGGRTLYISVFEAYITLISKEKKILVMLPGVVMVKYVWGLQRNRQGEKDMMLMMLHSSNLQEGYPEMTGWEMNANLALHF